MSTLKVNLQDGLKEHFLPYAGESILNFLPSIDGLLPVNRKVMVTMMRNGRTSDKPYVKSSKVIGEAVTLYIYGDGPLYSSMVNMANDTLNLKYIDGYGSWGSRFNKKTVAAASRYTECRMTKYAEDMIKGMNKNAVPMKPNFDNTTDEPVVLPSVAPNILLNTTQSISLSEASKMPAHNVKETCDSIIEYIRTEDIDRAIDLIKCPDFDNGAVIIYDKSIFNKIYKTGRGTFSLVGKYRYIEKENKIEIYEIPYETTINSIEKDIRTAYDKGNFKEITNLRNASGRQGLQLDIQLKRNTNIDQFITKLRKYTAFESKFSCNFTILDLDFKTPVLVNLQGIYDRWIQHRINCINNETQFDIDKKSAQLHLLKGLEKILLNIDDVVKDIRATKKQVLIIPMLKDKYNLDDKQAEYVSNIRLINLNEEYIMERTSDIEKLNQEIHDLNSLLHNESEIKQVIISQLQDVIKKYAQPRRTEIITEDTVPDTKEVIVDDYAVRGLLTQQGYFKKLLRNTDNQKLKDGDSILTVIDSNNKDDLLFLTDYANCYRLKCYELNEHKPSQLGEYLPNLLQMEKDEKIIHVVSTNTYSGYLLICYENGKVAKINLASYQSNRSKLANSLNTDNQIVRIIHAEKDVELALMSSINKVLVYNTSNINAKSSRSTMGNQVMKSKNDSKVIGVKLANEVEFEDMSYYKTESAGVGKYLKKGDKF